ncbi:hypothetical protein GCM10027265_18820 [Jatrophihabitans fulvus]
MRLSSNDDLAVDVELNGQRVWSFNPRRDATKDGELWLTEWPKPLRPHLKGRAHVVLREHVSRRVLAEHDATFGDAEKTLAVVDAEGHPLSIDKIGRLGRNFDERDPAIVTGLLDATEKVLTLLSEQSDVTPFVAFGALLGAIRDGKLIGHDVDIDLGYLSKHTHPVDVARESFGLERIFRRAGWDTVRFSAADFKVIAPDIPGVPDAARYIDIFGGFVADGTFYLMPNVAVPVGDVSILPLGQITLEGRTLPGPADPESLLLATYGPGWVTPDPAFKYKTPRSTVRRMDAWMRNGIANRSHWFPFYNSAKSKSVPTEPSAFARTVAEAEKPGTLILDIGCGTGRDSIWFSKNGFDAIGMDYAPSAVRSATEAAEAQGASATFKVLNLLDMRQVLGRGAVAAHDPRDKAVYGRFLLHALTPEGRRNLWRFGGLALAGGGRFHLEFRTGKHDEGYEFGDHYRDLVAPEVVISEIEAAGGRVDHHEVGYGFAVYKDEDPYVCRMVATWQR